MFAGKFLKEAKSRVKIIKSATLDRATQENPFYLIPHEDTKACFSMIEGKKRFSCLF